jgi:phospholipid/cholesterol/gamma-HCH transport system substrate-binding protein
MGNKYVALEPGAEEKMLEPGGQIMHTQSSINLEDLVSRYVFGAPKKEPAEGGAEGRKSAP